MPDSCPFFRGTTLLKQIWSGCLLVLWVFAGSAGIPAAKGDGLDDVRARGVLIWGADQEGGGPFIFPREDNPQVMQGFEVELADLIATSLGVRAEYHQGQWDKLPEVLDRGDIDVVLNGYEWTPSRSERYGTSLPYYIYSTLR